MTDKEVDAGAGDAKRLWRAGMRRKEATINSLTNKEVDGCMGGAKHLQPARTRKANNKCDERLQ